MRWLRQMLACRWAARRIQRYLDADPSATLPAREVARLERHLGACARCGRLAGDYERLSRALGRLGERSRPDPALVSRLERHAEQIAGIGGDR